MFLQSVSTVNKVKKKKKWGSSCNIYDKRLAPSMYKEFLQISKKKTKGTLSGKMCSGKNSFPTIPKRQKDRTSN